MLRYIFPPRCQICLHKAERHQLICSHCYSQLPLCDTYQFRKKELTCYTACHYSGLMKRLISELKFGEQLQHTRLLGQLLVSRITQHYTELPQLIIPVPLHKQRLQQRGFNQALEIAKEVSNAIHIPIAADAIWRHKATQPQAQCTASQRERNIKNAFRLHQSINAHRIILLDDVITTGNTVRECSRCLKQANIEHIDCWSVAS